MLLKQPDNKERTEKKLKSTHNKKNPIKGDQEKKWQKILNPRTLGKESVK